MMRCVAVFLLVVFVCSKADVYMHNPRGSNNRLNERSANRQNGNRMFDSQNNNRGGYNVGDSTSQASNNEDQQYRMKYFESGPYKTMVANGQLTGQGQSLMTVEWTNQHGCGGDEDTDPHKLNCNIVLQYMCQDDAATATGDDDTIRNGRTTQTQNHQRINNLNENQNQANNRKNNAVRDDRGLHETWDWYDKCYNRERNMGLFTADQKLKTNNGNGYSSAIYTRQNPNGNRRGYECPEERDYYPYWHPSPWRDMALLVSNMSLCEFYQSESFNVKTKYECVETYGNGQAKHWSRWNNEADCTENGGQWLAFTNYLEKAPQYNNEAACEARSGTDGVRYVWGRPEGEMAEQCLVAVDPPDCQPAPWTRVNHLGNTRGGKASRYEWTIPYFPSGNDQRCVMRLRYNITTDDYDPINTDASQNQDINAGVLSPIQQNPYVDIGADRLALRLAINTAQYGRTFQDRSHAFLIRQRPNVPDMAAAKIYNLNVRGKRGNIVQVYPAVEYDFIPNDLEINEGDLVHMQWTGSNTHNNNAPGGDGQTGDAGEGRGGTDRSNIVQIQDRLDNFPMPFEQTTMWTGAQVRWMYTGNANIAPMDLAVNAGSSGYYQCMEAATCRGESVQNKNKLNNQLNNAPASYEGALVQFAKGEYFYMGSRNNNFSNRSQKGRLMIK
ncbi:protein DD3-3-like isoform X1 [Acanthaster planci]|uniref:Protein DD3-3-like isoform X1 n=2 Tax=Acanthaster planci TaxID=133434 RepID=A0A8B7ZSK6_ACAPL|nr:protein DD3-3-like isoform X1 [Acanthaster planci]XP_022106442.1 protein DD3-3-like isoform X1 [Acanthaster planci]XP_022106443.1 protein DD3-3-like isoform X1 [Acanthaster planci]XP_022106444.1 protein DD3-3-like isoform X1 [Acanthaster planci]